MVQLRCKCHRFACSGKLHNYFEHTICCCTAPPMSFFNPLSICVHVIEAFQCGHHRHINIWYLFSSLSAYGQTVVQFNDRVSLVYMKLNYKIVVRIGWWVILLFRDFFFSLNSQVLTPEMSAKVRPKIRRDPKNSIVSSKNCLLFRFHRKSWDSQIFSV